MIFLHSGRQLLPLSGPPRRLHQASTILGTITRLAKLEARLRPRRERHVLRTRARVDLGPQHVQKIVEPRKRAALRWRVRANLSRWRLSPPAAGYSRSPKIGLRVDATLRCLSPRTREIRRMFRGEHKAR